MRNGFYTAVVTGMATLFLAAPGFAGDTEQCNKGSDCCKVTGKECGPKAGHKASKQERRGNRNDRNQKAEHRMDKLTKFTFHQSGGFMGVNKQYEVNLADLSEQDRKNLEELIAGSGLLKAAGGEQLTRGAADMFNYSFSAVEGNKTHSITFDDGTLPQSYRPLLAFTKDKAVDANRK